MRQLPRPSLTFATSSTVTLRLIASTGTSLMLNHVGRSVPLLLLDSDTAHPRLVPQVPAMVLVTGRPSSALRTWEDLTAQQRQLLRSRTAKSSRHTNTTTLSTWEPA